MDKIFFLAIIALNVLVDIGHKVTLQNIVFKTFDGTEQIILTTIINALIIIPFILLFSPSSFISNKYPKDKIIKTSAFIGMILSAGMVFAYLNGLFFVSFGILFLLGIQSAIYSPAKYAYIKILYGKDNLAKGNSHVQATVTFFILFSLTMFSFLFENSYSFAKTDLISPDILLNSFLYISQIILGLSIFEFILSLKFKTTEKTNSEMKFSLPDYFQLKLLKKNINILKNTNGILLSIIGLSILMGITQGLLAVFPAYAQEFLHIDNVLEINGLWAMAGLGMILGSFIYSKYSTEYIELGTVPIGGLGVTTTLFLMTILDSYFLLSIDFIFFGIFGALFIVPLNSFIQFNAEDKSEGSVLAGNNWVQSVFFLIILSATTLFATFNINSLNILYIFTFILAIGSLFTLKTLPQSLIQFVLSAIIKMRYKLTVHGIKNIPSEGPVLFLGNHISFLDWAIVQMSSPRSIKFVMDKKIYNKWYLKYILNWFGAIPIASGGSVSAMKTIAQELDKGHCVCLFPEGAITRNGSLSEFKKGFEKILEFTENKDIKIIPFYLHGLWGTVFGRANDYYVKKVDRYFEVSISFGETVKKDISAVEIKKRIFDLSITSWNAFIEGTGTLADEIIKRAKFRGNQFSMADTTGLSLSGHKLLGLSVTLRNILEKRIKGQNIGLILPSTVIGNVTNLSTLMLGKTLVNLNYTSTIESLVAAAELADLKTIISSKKFIDKIKGKGFDLTPLLNKVEVIYLEDLKEEMTKPKILLNIIKTRLCTHEMISKIWVKNTKMNDTVAILFSSGSEGTPKGIELTNKNIIGNIKQVSNILDLNEDDVIIGNLPIFHAFGITVTTLLPMVEGIPVVSHPDPTDGLNIAKLAFKYKATVLIGTSTFLRLYTNNKKINPLMFESLRLVISGAEKLNEKVRLAFKEKYNKDILEGYGATETTPVASVNIPNKLSPEFNLQVGNKQGTVGMPVPGSSMKIVDPQDLEEYRTSLIIDEKSGLKHNLVELKAGEEGMILIGGTQIMKGYLKNPEKTREALIMIDGSNWYITGDKGRLDEDGFLTIVDRYSRFAKLGGEMVSLTSVEDKVSKIMDNEEFDCMAINLPDVKKGEKILLIYTGVDEDIMPKLKSGFENKLMLPYKALQVEDIPKLGTGKKDFKTAKVKYENN